MRTPLRHIAQHAGPRRRCHCKDCPTTVYPVYVVPGPAPAPHWEEDTMRFFAHHHPRPAYVPDHFRYVPIDSVRTAPEFIDEVRDDRRRRIRALIGVGVGMVLAFLLLALAASYAAGGDPEPRRPVFVTPSPTPTPNYSPPGRPDDILGADIIWTNRNG